MRLSRRSLARLQRMRAFNMNPRRLTIRSRGRAASCAFRRHARWASKLPLCEPSTRILTGSAAGPRRPAPELNR